MLLQDMQLHMLLDMLLLMQELMPLVMLPQVMPLAMLQERQVLMLLVKQEHMLLGDMQVQLKVVLMQPVVMLVQLKEVPIHLEVIQVLPRVVPIALEVMPLIVEPIKLKVNTQLVNRELTLLARVKELMDLSNPKLHTKLLNNMQAWLTSNSKSTLCSNNSARSKSNLVVKWEELEILLILATSLIKLNNLFHRVVSSNKMMPVPHKIVALLQLTVALLLQIAVQPLIL